MLLDPLGVRHGPHQVAAELQHGLHVVRQHGLACLHHVEARLARRLEPVELAQLVQRHQLRLLRLANRALALGLRRAV